MTDEQLILDVRNGSRESFELLFERYRAPVWRFFRRRTTDPGRAEELAQDTFVALLEGASRYKPLATFRTYLFAIAYNILRADRRKSTTRRQVTDTDARSVAADPDTALWIREALSALDADEREIVMLREYEELSYQEIADLCQMPLNTVRSKLFRARMALRAMLAADRAPSRMKQ